MRVATMLNNNFRFRDKKEYLFGTSSSGGNQAHSRSFRLTNEAHKTCLLRHTGLNPSCGVIHFVSK